MALDERQLEHDARERHGSLESHGSAQRQRLTPAPAAAPAEAPAPRFDFERFGKHPLVRLVLKALGIALLMLGLAAIGALSMKKGLGAPKLALGNGSPRASPASGLLPAQASLLAAVPSDHPAEESSSAGAEVKTRSEGMTEDGRVILNRASVEDLRRLPGIGQKRAEAILALRQKLGRFKRTSDLLRVRGIGQRRLKQLLPKLVLDAPAEAPAKAAPAGSASR
jgi:competence protein ComEA